MKLKIKEIIEEGDIIKIIFYKILSLDKDDILDFYKEGNIYYHLRSELGIIYGMIFIGDVLEITTLEKYSEEVKNELIKYFL